MHVIVYLPFRDAKVLFVVLYGASLNSKLSLCMVVIPGQP